MPKIRTPDTIARKHLFSGNNSELIRKTGISRATFYARKKRPGDLTLDELALLIAAQEIAPTPEELYNLVTERG